MTASKRVGGSEDRLSSSGEGDLGDPEVALRAFARGQRVIGANSNVVAEDGMLRLTLTGCKIGQLVKETPHLCDLEEMYLDSLMKRTGAKGAQRRQCLAEGDGICSYEVELDDGTGAL